MSSLTRTGVLLGAALAGSLAVSGYAGAFSPAIAGAAQSKKALPVHGGVLNVALTTTPGTLDPNLNTAFAEFYVAELLYGSLMQRGVTQNRVMLGDASSYTHPNATTYDFTLRKGLEFSNGAPVTSADVKFSFDRLITPKTASPWAADFKDIAAITTPTPSTVVFHLQTPFAPFLSYLSEPTYAPIISPAEVSTYGNLKTHALGTGPFELVSFTPGVSIVLKRNPHYWQKGLPYLSGIDMRIMASTSTRLAALESGQVNLAWFLTPRIQTEVPASSHLKVLQPKLATNDETLIFNQTKPPFNNVAVRRAVSEALTRRQIIKVVLNGHGTVGSKIPPGERPYGYNGPMKGLPYNLYKPKAAKALLAKAGYPGGFTTQLAIDTAPQTVRTAQLVKAQLAKIGIRVSISESTHITMLHNFVSTNFPGMSMDDLVWQPDPDTSAYDVMYSSSPINLGKFNSPVVDALLNRGRLVQTVEKRAKIYIKLQKYVATKAYMVFPFDRPAATQVVTANVHGFVPEISGLHEAALVRTWLSKG